MSQRASSSLDRPGPVRRMLARSKDQPAGIEGGVLIRAVMGLSVMISIAAVLSQDVVSTGSGFVALLLIPTGFTFSYYRRNVNQIAVKFVLAGGLILVFANFLRSVSGATSIDDARGPLAEIFLWVQVLHSFDLPRRKDLQFSLASSVALIALGGSIAIDATFLFFFVPWGIAALAAMVLTHLSELEEVNQSSPRPRQRGAVGTARGFAWAWRPAVTGLAVIMIAGTATFLFTPRGRGARITSLPFEIPSFIPVPEGSGVVNKGLPSSGEPGEDPAKPDPNTYFGFANFVDLRVRGELSDALVMRVRSPQPAFWRAAVFDVYESSTWKHSSEEVRPSSGTPANIPPERGFRARSVELTQTFYIERAQTNLIFSAYHPEEVWLAGGTFDITDERTMRARFVLEEGTVYSIVSRVPAPSRDQLEMGPDQLPTLLQNDYRTTVERYTQLPSSLPKRVRELAQRVAGDQPTTLGKALAIQSWLKNNAEYDLTIPPQPRGSDGVDHFLFEEKRGYCEQIASSMAVMLRSLGVPARFAVGYEPGERNIFSGYFEVRAHDAHSWVEVYFPMVGWVQFDPTHEVPFAEPDLESSTPGLSLLKKLFSAIGSLFPDGFGEDLAAFIRSSFATIARSGPAVAATLVGMAAVAALLRLFGPRIRRKLALLRVTRKSKGPLQEVVSGAFRVLEMAGAQVGFPRAPYLTPGEYGRALTLYVSSFNRSDVERIVSALERELYGGLPVGADEARGAEEAALRLLSGAPQNGR